MKAVVYNAYGSPDVLRLEEVEKPVPGKNEILVKIYATSVSSGDSRLRRADPFVARFFNGLTRPEKMTVLGNELSGVVESVGSEVKAFMEGDEVFGQSHNLGTNAEYIVLTENELAPKPENLSFEEAAVIPFGGNTAWDYLQKASVRDGQKVLVYGASGSVGTAAIQIAKHLGAEVTGVCSTKNLDLVKSLGADHVIDYTEEDFTRNGITYDAIFDTVGKSPFSRSVTSLSENGYYLRAVHMSPSAILRGAWTSLTSNRKVIGGVAAERKEHLLFLKELAEKGALKPVIDRRYPLNRTAEAHRYVDKGHKRGNVVITVNRPSGSR